MNGILFLLRSFGVGGAERQLCMLASGLQQSGYQVKVAVFYAGEPMEAEARSMGIQIIDLKRRGRWDLLPFFFRLVKLVKTQKPDLLHSYLQVPNIWAAFIKMVLPRTKVVWGIRASNVEMKQYGWQWELTDKAESLLANIPDWIICNSQAGMHHAARNRYPVGKMSVVPNGIDRQRFFPNRQAGLRLRKEWDIEAKQKLIGIVGRLDPMKDFPNFLQAAALLARERNDLRFVCVGGGPDQYVHEYRELSSSLQLDSCLRWAGERKDLPDIYNALDVLVSSSAYGEGFSNVLGEAMACGTLCVATDVGDAAYVIGGLGEIVPPRDPEALKCGISTLLERLENNNADLKKEAEQRIINQFSVEKLASRTVDVFNTVLARKI